MLLIAEVALADCSPGRTRQVACKCWNETHFINETIWTDSSGGQCRVTSEPCTCTPQTTSPSPGGLPVITVEKDSPGGTPPPRCAAGFKYIGEAYGDSPSGGGAWLQLGRVNFPEGFQLDDSFVQQTRPPTTGGGARSPWKGDNIPAGIAITVSGAHYWSVGVPAGGTDGLPDLTFNKKGEPKQFTIGMYCGPAGRPGPGCNVRVSVCAKSL
jgi:hypothetical protein